MDMQTIREQITNELTPSKERGKYLCPLCGSGSHGASSTAAMSIDKDGVHAKCFACGFYGDIFDLIGARDGLTPEEARAAVLDKYNGGSMAPAKPRQEAKREPAEEPARDIPLEVARFHAALTGSEGEKYLQGRGISAETMARFRLGYDANRRAVTIPYNPAGTYYDCRAVRDDAKAQHMNLKGVTMPLFNSSALYGKDPCFIVESPLCAISITQSGGAAVAISGTAGKGRLEKQIKERKPSALLILCLDNDEPGRNAQEDIKTMLQAHGCACIPANVAGPCKDPNELLQKDPAQLAENVKKALQLAEVATKQAEEAAKKAEEEAKRARAEEYAKGTAAGFVDELIRRIEASKKDPSIPTGYTELDKMLDGGLFPGLYVIGAITSLGKTTFTLQMCDHIARSGQDVLFFALEMSKDELVAKTVSRLTFEACNRQGLPTNNAKTTRGVMNGKRWKDYSRQEMELLAGAFEEYKNEIGAHIRFFEGVGNIGVDAIKEAVAEHITITGRAPVVVVDYVQLLAPVDLRASDKQNTDRNVLELKRLSRDHNIPVVCISSLNRDNYTAPINNAAFKESGALEYGSDCLIGLQYEGMEYRDGEKDKDRDQRIRGMIEAQRDRANAGGHIDIELKLLKNRNGRSGTRARFKFIPMFNKYSDVLEGYTEVDEKPPFKPAKRPL